MPSFTFPPAAGGGGGGGGGTLPVLGGSGAQYATVAAAQAIEVETVIAGIAAGAGTAPGIFRSAAIPVQPVNFYKDFYVVVVTAVPGNGLVCRHERISAYDGIDQLTLDGPWDLTGQTIDIVSPIRLALLADIQEDITFTKNVEFDLGGHRVKGFVDQAGGDLCWIRGGGWITDGVQKTNIGVLQIDGAEVSRRGSTIYAVLMTNGSNLGRTILTGCHFDGVVAGRRGRAGWEVSGCRNNGIAEANRNIPYRFFESVAGVAVVVTQADWTVEGEWSGAVFYSENSLTGGAAFVNGQINAKTPKMLTATVMSQQPVFAYLYCGVGAATLTMTWLTNGKSTMTVVGNDFVAGTLTFVPDGNVGLCGMGLFIDFTGTFSVDFGGGGSVNRPVSFVGVGSHLVGIHVRGTATMSGTITTSNGAFYYSATSFNYARVFLEATISGTITDGCDALVHDVRRYIQIVNTAVQGNPSTVSLTARTIAQNIFAYTTFDMIGATSAGTWAVSGQIEIHSLSTLQTVTNGGTSLGFATLSSVVSGGTFTVSGLVGIFMAAGDVITTTSFFFATHLGTGGTLTLSAIIRIVGGLCGEFRLIDVTGAGASVTVSGAVTLRQFKMISGPTNYIRSVNATSTAIGSGAQTFEVCEWDAAFTFINLLNGALTGPTSVTFETCVFKAALSMESVTAGVLTWTSATVRFRNSHVEGTFSFSGNRFATVECFDSFFNGTTGDESVNPTATRPALYRYWNCKFRAEHLDLEPDILDDWISVNVGGPALVKGQLATIGAAGTAVDPAAASVVEGVVMDAAGGGGFAILVRRGVIPVLSQVGGATGVSPGDNTGLDTGTPIQQEDTAAVVGQRIGRALGAPAAGLAYTIVDLR
jgi:hypothetical protein